ncbi:ATP-binding region ATPase domain protein [Ferroglobus placidus DSM 10642]|uniref:ATP-binding region ATPase domain protein n=1 Tax=Ferroglobus placidus (strain DSM 10642 / AEDII12DO) TaxID=589924 RepID=D3S384_FERPA|nr:ATP-binding protein [Ferroglobus placidus]ADC64717.1 ATP-binding region ATPase domain protein [Ferroglobus placidus DSM 10642]
MMEVRLDSGSCSERISWNFELNVIKEYLSRFYYSDFACIREYVANAIAAQHAAGVKDAIHVEITPGKIVVEDRGIGISRQKFEEVFMWFGRSSNAELEGVQGRLGLGAKSFMMLTGDTGKVVMKTKSRETGESYTAVLTATGAEIVESEGKEEFGTRFEIYPETPLSPEKLSDFYSKVAMHFDFSRIPVHVKVYADEPFRVVKTGREISVEWVEVEDDGYRWKWWFARSIEAVFGIQNHQIEIIEDNAVYELGVMKGKQRNYGVVVVGDVRVDKTFEDNLFIRIKAEDGRKIEMLGVEVRVPEPLPNRDEYKGLDDFLMFVGLQYRIRKFIEKGYDRFLNSSVLDIIRHARLKELEKEMRHIKDAARSWRTYDERALAAIENALPGFARLEKTVRILLTELPAYGRWGYLVRNRRRAVEVATVIRYAQGGEQVGYLTKRPDARKERVLDEKDIYAVYTEDPEIIAFLERNGVKELKVKDERRRVKIYEHVWGEFEGGNPEYVEIDNLVYRWSSEWNESGKIIIFTTKVSDLKGKYLPPCLVVTGGKKLYSELKEVFGDFLMTYDEWEEMVRETTVITDGQKVMALSDLDELEPGERGYLVETAYPELIPALRKVSGIYTFVDVTDYTIARNLFNAKKLEKVFGEWTRYAYEWDLNFMAGKIGREAAEAIHLLLKHGKDYSCIDKELVEIACRHAGVKGKTMEELKEVAKPVVERIVEKYGTLRLGRKFPVEAILYRGSVGGFDGITAGIKLANPLIPTFTYEMAGKAGEEGLKLKRLQSMLGIFGALVWYVEKGGTLDKPDGEKMMAEEVVRKLLPAFVRSDNDWKQLVKIAPRVSKKLALAALL